MKIKNKCEVIVVFLLCVAVLTSYSSLGIRLTVEKENQTVQAAEQTQISQSSKESKSSDKSQSSQEATKKKYIKWMSFDVPGKALTKAMNLDIKSYGSVNHLNWIELLAYLATKYGGNWKRYKVKDMDAVVNEINGGSSISELADSMKNYSFFYKAYDAVLDGYLGEYTAASADGGTVTKYGLRVFSPIAGGYCYSHYDDFGDSRSFGFRRPHLGNDLLGSIGTPIVAVESGVVESLGWNRYGGWRVGIRSFDHKRYYYYAHLRKTHPYVNNLKQGMIVKAGNVIGYLGMTGYSNKEGVNNMTKPHLHFGIQVIFDESQKDGNNQIWIDAYNIVNILSKNKAVVKRDAVTGDYYQYKEQIVN